MSDNGPAKQSSASTPAAVQCCPQLEPCQVSDVLNFTYRLPFNSLVAAGDQRQVVPVEVTLHYRLTRCSGPLSLGDLMYTTTLLPGEKVQLYSSDRHSRFSFDSETKLSYHTETTSEESYYAAGMAYGMSKGERAVGEWLEGTPPSRAGASRQSINNLQTTAPHPDLGYASPILYTR